MTQEDDIVYLHLLFSIFQSNEVIIKYNYFIKLNSKGVKWMHAPNSEVNNRLLVEENYQLMLLQYSIELQHH